MSCLSTTGLIGLNQFQAKESTDISDEIYKNILNELKKMRVSDINKVKYNDIKTILKKLRLNKYYEHIPHIMCKITGNSPPTLSRAEEESLKQMFEEIQSAYEKYKPQGRTNFLSYSYILHKTFQILKLDRYIDYFPLLKSREKLRAHDKVWKLICEDLGWTFIPSI